MLSSTKQNKYATLRHKRKQKNKIKRKIVCILFLICAIGLILQSLKITYEQRHVHLAPTPRNPHYSRILLQQIDAPDTDDAAKEYPEGYPPDLLTPQQQRNGGWLLYFLGMVYTFIGIALVCDEWFVPAIECIVERIDMTPDAAGATFMAAGGSAPELFTSLIGTFISRSNVGFGTIVGSAVFNVLFVIGCCAIFTPGHLPLTWWPFARDCLYYIMSLFVLSIFYGVVTPNRIEWWEAVILLCLYLGYATLMFNNQKIHNYLFTRVLKKDPTIDATMDMDMELEMERTEATVPRPRTPSEAANRTPTLSNMGSSSAGVHFHASIYNFLTKDSSVKELMGVHIVARIKGETKETFDSIDADGNGHIDREELRQVLFNLGEQVMDDDVTNCFNEIDTDGNGEISYAEFEHWYLASKMRMTTDIKKIFVQFDDNGDQHIDCYELHTLLTAMNSDIGKEITDEDVERAMNELGKKSLQDVISEQEFIGWYSNTSYFEQKKMQRQATLTTVAEEEEAGIEIEFPQGLFERVMFVITAPIMYSLYFTLPDVQKNEKKHLWPATFSGSMVWLMFYSYLMVWWATRIGAAWGVPDEVMGLTFLAAGTSVPDLLSSVIVAKMGKGDMAVSSSIGSNIFDILIGLPLPWLLFCVTLSEDYSISVTSESLFLSIIILIVMLVAVLCVIRLNKWKLTHRLGWTMFVLWIMFVAQDLIRQFCKNCNP